MKKTTFTTLLVQEHPTEFLLRRVTIGLIILSFFGYVYFVSSTVINIIAGKEANTHTASLTSSIAELESEYFARTNEISKQTSESLGLVPVGEKHFVTRVVLQARNTTSADEI